MNPSKSSKILINNMALYKFLRRGMSRANFYESYELSIQLTNKIIANAGIIRLRGSDRMLSENEELKFVKKFKK